MKMEDLLAFSPVYQAGKAVQKGKLPGALFGLTGLAVEQHGKRKRKKKKKRQTEVGQTQKFNRGGMVNKSKIMHGYKKGGQV